MSMRDDKPIVKHMEHAKIVAIHMPLRPKQRAMPRARSGRQLRHENDPMESVGAVV